MELIYNADLHEVKKTRAGRPKARTGCLTCRARRVKCDESRPVCLKCTTFGRECGGYQEAKAIRRRLPRLEVVAHHLLPKVSRENERLLSHKVPIPIRSYNMTEKDGQFLQLYQQDIAAELSGGFGSTLWYRIILQACDNASIRSLIVAIAAVKQNARTQSSQPNESRNHRYYALQKYSQGLNGIQEQLSRDPGSTRLALIGALLIFVFEALLGDMKIALNHVQSALDLINQRQGYKAKTSPDPRGTVVSTRAPKPGAPDFIENEILKTFMRLDRPGIKLFGAERKNPRPVRNRALTKLFYIEDYQIPSCFTCFEEALHYFECMHFRLFPEQDFKKKLRGGSTPTGEATSSATLLMWLLTELPESTAIILREEARSWQLAFERLLRHSRRQQGASEFIAATTLSIQTASIEVSLSAITNVPGNMDDCAETSRNLLIGARDIVSHPKYTKGFVFEVGVIPPLFTVIVYSPNMLYKKEALGILREMQPRVECVWDSRVVADAGEAFIEMLERTTEVGETINIRHHYEQIRATGWDG
ncbi:transcription regulator [Hyphodiscus hymeniophilus]|uniref:Transcription regulator n=1 Tax=Hyphodiscus hymeniophilus TaxID=353542 RepID=A0A9P6VGX0_9HELO|nr:transcription regulator [Hyphodiscus hymeniophilus]